MRSWLVPPGTGSSRRRGIGRDPGGRRRICRVRRGRSRRIRGMGETDDIERLAAAVRAGDRPALARAITLVESSRAADREAAQELLGRLLPHTGGAQRVGVSGVPGVGKSTLIDVLGTRLIEAGHRVAVLAVDPSSGVSGGSILGDKTQMSRLGRRSEGFIRPSPSARSLGGVGRRTRESMLLCEAAGYDVVFVETVGVGQSEVVVASMVDTFVLLMLPGGGDELQGIKKGIVELADIIAVNKADGAHAAQARETAAEYSSARRYAAGRGGGWSVPVLLVSARTGEGIDALWQAVHDHRAALERSGELDRRRQRQRLDWLESLVQEQLLDEFAADERVRAARERLQPAVLAGDLSPMAAARELLAAFRGVSDGDG